MIHVGLGKPRPPTLEIKKKTCDFCEVEIQDPEDYRHEKVVIKREHGTCYPEGNFVEVEEADCCQACWIGRVRPALAALMPEGRGFRDHDQDEYFGGAEEAT